MARNRVERRTTVNEEGDGLRVDRYLADSDEFPTRSQLRALDLRVAVNGLPVKLSHRICAGDAIEVSFLEAASTSIQAEPLDLDILFENADVIVVNKPQGLVVHPAAGNWSGTLVQGLMHHVESLGAMEDAVRPGIVHRLDKETSGVLIAAKNPQSQEYLANQFRKRSVRKEYVAVVKGTPPASTGRLSQAIARDPRNRKKFTTVDTGGKAAETEYRVVRHFRGYCLVEFHPVTGRTHQIRVHAKHMGCPVLGDSIYARRDPLIPEATLMLHAQRLTIMVPGTEDPQTFEAPLPDRFTSVLRVLEDLPLGG